MLQNPKIVVAVFSLFVTMSCGVYKGVELHDNIIKLEKGDFQKLNGTINNCPIYFSGKIKRDMVISQPETLTFSDQLLGLQRNYHYAGIDTNEVVAIAFPSSRKAIFKIYNKDTLVFTKKVHGKIKKGYFYKRPHFIVIPFIPLFFGYETRKYRIGITDKNTIVIDFKWDYWKFAMVAGDLSKGSSSSEFKKED